MAQSAQSPYQKAKNSFNRRGSSVDDLKFTLRKQFRNRLRDLRSKSIDSCRSLTDEVNRGYQELVEILEKQALNNAFIQPENVMQTLREIQQEMLEQIANEQASDYESFLRDEVDAIVENLGTCKVCEEYSEQDICQNCQRHFAD